MENLRHFQLPSAEADTSRFEASLGIFFGLAERVGWHACDTPCSSCLGMASRRE